MEHEEGEGSAGPQEREDGLHSQSNSSVAALTPPPSCSKSLSLHQHRSVSDVAGMGSIQSQCITMCWQPTQGQGWVSYGKDLESSTLGQFRGSLGN